MTDDAKDPGSTSMTNLDPATVGLGVRDGKHIATVPDDATQTDVLTDCEERETFRAENDRPGVSAKYLAGIIRRLEDGVRHVKRAHDLLSQMLAEEMKRAEQAEADAAAKGDVLKKVEWCDWSQDGAKGKAWREFCPWNPCGAEKGTPHLVGCPIGKALSGDAGKGKVLVDENELAQLRGIAKSAGTFCDVVENSAEGGTVIDKQELAGLRAVKEAARTVYEETGWGEKGDVLCYVPRRHLVALMETLDAADANAAGRKDGE